jgi:hypothetical protein
MATCPEYACLICDLCDTKPTPITEMEVTPTPKRKRTDTTSKKNKPPKGLAQIADATIVYVLGRIDRGDGSYAPQLDVYSGLNGYHLRSVPADKRWSHAVMVGAGAGILAVVDRFGENDLIRLTDKYLGLGEHGFDSDGYALPETDWASVRDIGQIPTPTGTRCTGLKILPNGLLIICLTDPAGKARFMRVDARGYLEGEHVIASIEGANYLQEPYDTVGSLLCNPAYRDANTTDKTHDMFVAMSSATYSALAVVNALTTKVVSVLGLPEGLTPMGVAFANNVVTALMGQGGVGTELYRCILERETTLMPGPASKKATPAPQSYLVPIYPKFKDFEGQDQNDAEAIRAYLQAASDLNEAQRPVTVPTLEELPTLPSGTMSEASTQEQTTITPAYYDGRRIEVQRIPIPSGLVIRSIESSYSTVAELFNSNDATKPIFRMLHGSHYDIICDGGFTYGCVDKDTGKTVGMTNGLIGDSIATDKGYELGTLKTFDVKAALFDSATGKIVYHQPKILSNLRVYSGDFASLDPYKDSTPLEIEIACLQDDNRRLQANLEMTDTQTAEQTANSARISYLQGLLTASGVTRRTVCSDQTDSIISGIDGVKRTVVAPFLAPTLEPLREGVDPVAEFYSEGCLDDYWTMFLRRPVAPDKVKVVPVHRSWTRTDEDNALLPEWVNNNTNAITASGEFHIGPAYKSPQTKIDNPPIFNYSGSGGFYVPTLKFLETSAHARFREEISSIDDLLAASPAPEVAQAHAARRNIVSGWFGHPDETIWTLPRPLLKRTGPIDRSDAQNAPDYAIEAIGDAGRRYDAPVGPYAWVVVTITLKIDNLKGINIYINPAGRRGLGINVGNTDYESGHSGYIDAFGITGGSIYEAGYRTWSPDQAWGEWGYKTESMGGTLLHAPQDLIAQAAPSEVVQRLLTASQAPDISVEGVQTQTRVYAAMTPVNMVRVKFWLDHFAQDVYRVGYRTYEFGKSVGESPICAKTDPGYWVADNCEASACGNLTCSSASSGLNYKLFSTDPTITLSKKKVLQGEVRFSPKTNPYEAGGLLYGTVMFCNVEFDLNAPLRALDVSLP